MIIFSFYLFGLLNTEIVNDFPTDYIYEGKFIQPILNLNELKLNIDVYSCFEFDKQFHQAIVTRYGDYLTHTLHFYTFKSIPFENYTEDIAECYKLCIIFVAKILYYDTLFKINSDGNAQIVESNRINIADRMMIERMFQIILGYMKLEHSDETYNDEIKNFKKTLQMVNNFSFERIDLFRNFLCTTTDKGYINFAEDLKLHKGINFYFENESSKNSFDLSGLFYFEYEPETLSERLSHFFIVLQNLRKKNLLEDITEFNEYITNVIKTIIYCDFTLKKNIYKPQQYLNRSYPELSYKIMIESINLEPTYQIDIAEHYKNVKFERDQEYTFIFNLIEKFYKNYKKKSIKELEDILQYFGNIYKRNNMDIDFTKKIIISSCLLLISDDKDKKFMTQTLSLVEIYTISREIEIRVDLFYDRVSNLLSFEYITKIYEIINFVYEYVCPFQHAKIFELFKEFYINYIFLNTLDSQSIENNNNKKIILNDLNFSFVCIDKLFGIIDKTVYNISGSLSDENKINIKKKIIKLKDAKKNNHKIELKEIDLLLDSILYIYFKKEEDNLIRFSSDKDKNQFRKNKFCSRIIKEESYLKILKNVKILRKVKIPILVSYEVYNEILFLKYKDKLYVDFIKIEEKFLSRKYCVNYEGLIEFLCDEEQAQIYNEILKTPETQIKIKSDIIDDDLKMNSMSKAMRNHIDNEIEIIDNDNNFISKNPENCNTKIKKCNKPNKNLLCLFKTQNTRINNPNTSSQQVDNNIEIWPKKILAIEYISNDHGLKNYIYYILYNIEKNNLYIESSISKIFNEKKKYKNSYSEKNLDHNEEKHGDEKNQQEEELYFSFDSIKQDIMVILFIVIGYYLSNLFLKFY